MISDKDITKLKTVFATKEYFVPEFRSIRTEIAEVRTEVAEVRKEVAEVRLEVGELKDKMDEYLIKMDKTIEGYEHVKQENAAGGAIFTRHDRNIRQLASETGTKLSDDWVPA